MRHGRLLRLIHGAIVAASLCLPGLAFAQERPDDSPLPGAFVPALKDQLAKGLQARRPEEFAFIDKVVKLVEQERLSADLVRSSFLYVRKTRKDRKYLVAIFEQVLRARAAQAGIEL